MPNTLQEHTAVVEQCKELFLKKHIDYGSTAWRVLRLSTITDQIFINIKRIITIQNKGKQEVEDSIYAEFMGILNYAVIALIQIAIPPDSPLELDKDTIKRYYESVITEVQALLQAKNHDYGEAWREMRLSSITDFILAKVYRIKRIEDNAGQTLVSEGVKAIYQDILNYAAFCLIRLKVA